MALKAENFYEYYYFDVIFHTCASQNPSNNSNLISRFSQECFDFTIFFSFLGYSYDTDCIYINGTGSNDYEFYIQLNRCGTLGGSDHNKKRDAKYKNSEPTVRKTIFVVIFIV